MTVAPVTAYARDRKAGYRNIEVLFSDANPDDDTVAVDSARVAREMSKRAAAAAATSSDTPKPYFIPRVAGPGDETEVITIDNVMIVRELPEKQAPDSAPLEVKAGDPSTYETVRTHSYEQQQFEDEVAAMIAAAQEKDKKTTTKRDGTRVAKFVF